ncbi:alpha/beta hydrolase [Roseibium sp. RKSG952]|uniref:alpha/beta hydrolase family protein n=1 Tax=Roseibium sp. RKSG952 TaxID=2529384 RepID=UPI0012BD38BB|nr:alpha/beta hydrolase [Roseibium sp. RKSG952]MTH95749.1 alpha/beta hydrolase [Roseibium sp. RKSG952]
MTTIDSETVTFSTEDGCDLAGDLYIGQSPKIAVVISGGTGFPRRFYRQFASYLAEQGAVVLTYDYRGIGDSKGGSLKGSKIDLPDWGRHDLPAGVNALEKRFPGLPITHVGHSVGGHFVGLMPNHAKVARHAFLAVSTGYHGHHALSYRPTEYYFWWLLGPFSLLRHGYVKPMGGWRGEALPPQVFKTWRRWSHRRDYFKSEMDTTLDPQRYAQVDAPIRSWLFSDDPIATAKASDVMLGFYPNALKTRKVVSPEDIGVKRIGHEGAFRPDCTKLWNEVWDWLSQAQGSTQQPETLAAI